MIRSLALLLLWPSVLAAQDLFVAEQQLHIIGFAPGQIDGRETLETQRAVYAFQRSYGRLATGRLSPSDARLLARSAEVSRIETPFVVAKARSQTKTPDEIFRFADPLFDRRIYANGAHYLASRGYFNYLPANYENRKTYAHLADTMEESRARNAAHRARANALVKARGDGLGAALMTLDTYANQEGETLEASVAAYATVLAAAQANPEESAFSATLIWAVGRRFVADGLCEGAHRPAVYALLEPAVAHVSRSGIAPLHQLALLRKAQACAPVEKRDGYFETLLAIAQSVSEPAATALTLRWARDAAERGATAVAQQKFQVAAQRILDGKVDDRTGSSGPDLNAMPAEDITAMHRLGMVAQARHMAQHRVRTIMAQPKLREEASRAEMANYRWAITTTNEMLLDTGQTDLSRHFSTHQVTRPFAFAAPVAGPEREWLSVRDAISARAMRDQHEGVLANARDILPQILDDGALATALELSLAQATSAFALGDYDTAEPAFVRIVTLAKALGVTGALREDIETARRALNLQQLEAMPPVTRAWEQIDRYYGTLCPNGRYVAPEFARFTTFDFEALGDDPDIRRMLVSRGVLSRVLACGIARRMDYGEARFICALSGFEGREDVVQYLLNGYVAPKEDYQRHDAMLGCAHGLADADRFAWFRIATVPQGRTNQERKIRYFAASAPDRAALQRAAADHLRDYAVDWYGIPPSVLEKDRDREAQEKIMRAADNTFHASHGNTGPGRGPWQDVRREAIAYQRLGLFKSAEALHYINRAGSDPFAYGTESAPELDRHLLDPAVVQNRLDHARLYRAWQRPERARAAIGPFVERAIARLGADADPLPGTVEQWAKRLEPLFAEYLLLQFDGLAEGPNYPAIFAIQQYLSLANSRASASVLEQRLNSASPAVAREYQDLRRRLRRALGQAGGDGSDVAALSLQLGAVEARLPKADAALKGHQTGVTRALRPTMEALRGSGDAMVVVTQLKTRAVVMVLDGRTAKARLLDIGARDAQAAVDGFRRGITQSSQTLDRFDTGRARALYETLIGWAHPPGGPAPERLRLVVDGPFATLPFAALRTPDGWLGARTALRFAPNVARASADLRRPAAGRGFLGFGDPNLTEGDTAARAALLGAGLHLPELPETAAELTFLALAFGGNPSSDVFTRDTATEAQLRALDAAARLQDTGVLALATHGLLSTEVSGLESAALVLSLPDAPPQDGLLTAAEIFGLRIGADLVILSACNTGTPGAGAGLSDLASAFLYAGAGALMLTHWEIDSGAGVELMKRVATGQRQAAEADYATHLRGAVAGLLADESLARFHHPRFWASHFILG